MDSIEGSTIANLVSRFREAPPATKTMRMKSSEFWWNSTQSPQHASRISSLSEADSELIANYATLPDAYVDIPFSQFDLESPVPVSKIAISKNVAHRLIMPTTNHIKVTKFNPNTDILHEWRSKRKREVMDYKTLASPGMQLHPTPPSLSSPRISTNIKKQNYYEELTNKYLPHSRGTQEHSICNPITHSPTPTAPATSWIGRDYCTNAETSVQTTDAITHGFSDLEACPRYNADTNNESVASVPIGNLSDTELATPIAPVSIDADTSTTNLRKQIDVSSQTKHLIRSETHPVRIMTNQSVQTSDTKEVKIQTTPLQSPPTRELLPARHQELEDTTLWSISSLTSQDPSDYTEKNRAGEDRQTTADGALEGIDEIDYLTLLEEDELIQLLVGKARFYEQHIENINALLNKDN